MAKTKDKNVVGIPEWLKGFIIGALLIIVGLLTGIQINTLQLSDMKTTLAGIEERTKDIEGVKSGVDKLLGRAGVAEITPTDGGTLINGNVEIDVPPNSVSEPILSRVEKIPSSSLPAALPNKNYEYSDGFNWLTQGVKFGSDARVEWGLAGSDCEQTKILYWNTTDYMWQEIPPEYCSDPTALVGFNVKTGGYYVLTRRIN